MLPLDWIHHFDISQRRFLHWILINQFYLHWLFLNLIFSQEYIQEAKEIQEDRLLPEKSNIDVEMKDMAHHPWIGSTILTSSKGSSFTGSRSISSTSIGSFWTWFYPKNTCKKPNKTKKTDFFLRSPILMLKWRIWDVTPELDSSFWHLSKALPSLDLDQSALPSLAVHELDFIPRIIQEVKENQEDQLLPEKSNTNVEMMDMGWYSSLDSPFWHLPWALPSLDLDRSVLPPLALPELDFLPRRHIRNQTNKTDVFLRSPILMLTF